MNVQTSASRLKVISYTALFTSIVFGITGQLLMKFTMSSKADVFLTSYWLLQLVLALAVYTLGVVNWVVALRHVKLSIAYPLTSLNYVGILLGSYYFFNEQITVTRALGVVLIFVGVLLVAIPFKQSRKLQKNQ